MKDTRFDVIIGHIEDIIMGKNYYTLYRINRYESLCHGLHLMRYHARRFNALKLFTHHYPCAYSVVRLCGGAQASHSGGQV